MAMNVGQRFLRDSHRFAIGRYKDAHASHSILLDAYAS
jgi:hypothetical protein